MQAVFERLTATGFAGLAGSRIAGRIPLREGIVNYAVSGALATNRRVRETHVAILRDARIEFAAKVSIGPFAHWFRPVFEVAASISPEGEPFAVLRPEPGGYGILLRLLEQAANGRLPSGVRLGNSQIRIDLSAFAAPSFPWRFLKRIAIQTEPGILWIDWEAEIA